MVWIWPISGVQGLDLAHFGHSGTGFGPFGRSGTGFGPFLLFSPSYISGSD